MQTITPKQKRLVGLIALIGMGAVAQFVESDRAPLYGITAEGEYLQAREPEILNDRDREPSSPMLAPDEWFNAFEDQNPPPAELLALGDWPLDPRGQGLDRVAGAGQVTGVEATGADASALAQAAAARLNVAESAPADALASDQTGKLEAPSSVTINPVASASLPQVIEREGQMVGRQTSDGMMEALVAAFDASGKGNGTEPVVPSQAPSRAEGTERSTGASVAASTDKAQDFLKSLGETERADHRESSLTGSIKQVASKSRDLVGEFIAFLGFGTPDNQPKAVAKAAKQELQQPLHDEIPSVPDGRRAIALQDGERTGDIFGQEQILLSAASLDDMRGGFEVNPEMRLSFGITRAVYINGNLVTTTALNMPDLAAAVGTGVGAAEITAANFGGVTVIQNGAGNTFQTSSISPNTLGTVIQNTLNNQKIQSKTEINVVANSMQLLKNIDLTRSIRDAQTLSRN